MPNNPEILNLIDNEKIIYIKINNELPYFYDIYKYIYDQVQHLNQENNQEDELEEKQITTQENECSYTNSFTR